LISHQFIEWKGAPDHGDAADYVIAGNTVEEIEAMVQDAQDTTDQDDAGACEEGESEARPDRLLAAFPIEVLPKPMRDLVDEGAEAIGCPPDFIALPALVCLGAAIGATHRIQVKAGYHQYPSIRGAVVADAGDKKSPAYELACEPIKKRQYELATKYEKDLAAYRAQADPQGPEPIMEQVWTSDTTLEALIDVLGANRRGIVFCGDEISGWALSMNQYKAGQGADRKHWLSLHDCNSIIVNRRNRGKGPTHVACPFVAVTGTIQPDILSDLSDERGREDGFIHRMLFSYPERTPLEWKDATVAIATRVAYDDLFAKLWSLGYDKDVVGSPPYEPHTLRFTDAGYQQWVKWVRDHYAQVNAPRFPDNLRGPWAKLEGYAARLALIIHLCRREIGETSNHHVDEVSMAAAGDLIDYFKSHARKVYAHMRATPEDKQALAAVAWIKRQPGCKVTARGLVRAGVNGVATTEEAKKLLQQLAERGYGKAGEQNSKRGKASFVFTLNDNNPTPDSMVPDQTGAAA
jgi:hypothetical protein